MPFVPERQLTRVATRRLERAFVACVAVFVVVGLTVPTAFGHAIGVNEIINTLLVVFAKFLEVLLDFIGTLVLLFVDMIISVAQYNDFIRAKPVEAGWPLVRDVVNMFFIVVLLITAFSTIIQYKKFQYKTVLPKLLLMAVLVNFSKTFIGLLIDVSQVIMLTFVNGFQAAAGANFTTALKLNQVLSLAQSGEFSSQAGAAEDAAGAASRDSMLIRIVMAELLGMFLLGVTLITLMIMLVYLVVRVVGLWIALIMSPAAFFATALESTPLSKGVAFIAGSFWPKLGALLSGGPIMAFFLWLTLATVQTGGFGDFSKVSGAAARGAEQAQTVSYFASQVGTAQEVATFFVAIMMLLMGLDAAVSIAGQVSSGLGNAAGRIRSTGMAATRFATYGGALLAGRAVAQAGRAGVRGGVAVTGAAAGGLLRAADSRLDISGKVGRGLRNIGLQVPGGTAIAKLGNKMEGFQGERRKAEQKRIQEVTENMSAGERLTQLQKMATYTGDKNEIKAIQIERGKTMTSKDGITALKDKYKEEGKKAGHADGSPELEAYADEKMREETGTHFAELKKLAKDTGDTELRKYVDDFQEKRPDLLRNDKDFEDDFTKRQNQGMNEFTKLPQEAWQDSRLASSILGRTDILEADENGAVRFNEKSEAWKKLVKGGGGRGRLIEQALQDAVAAGGGATATLGSVQAAAARGQRMDNRAYYMKEPGNQPGGSAWRRQSVQELTTAPTNRGRAVTRDNNQVAAARAAVDEARVAMADAPSVPQARQHQNELRDAQYEGMRGGARVSEMYGVDQNGSFTRDGDSLHFAQNVQRFMTNAAADSAMYKSLDMTDLHARPGAKNELRGVLAANANTDQMAAAWEQALGSGDQETLNQIQSAVGLIHQEGSRVEDRLRRYNQQHTDAQIDIDTVANAGITGDAAILEPLIAAMGNEKPTLEEARALGNKTRIDIHPELQHFRMSASDRMSRVAAERRQYGPLPANPPPPTPNP